MTDLEKHGVRDTFALRPPLAVAFSLNPERRWGWTPEALVTEFHRRKRVHSNLQLEEDLTE